MTQWTKHVTEYVAFLTAIGRPKTTCNLRRFQLIYLGKTLNLPLTSVSQDDLIEWFAIHEEWKPETRRSYRAAIRGFFSWAKESGRIIDDPATKLPQVRVPRAAARPTPEAVLREAIAAAEPRVALMLRLAAEAGLRRAEIARVHTRDLRHGAGGSQLLVHGKGSRQRVVPITAELAGLIARGGGGHTPGRGDAGWLFPSQRGGHISPYYVGILCARALPDDWTLHTARHLFASKAYRGTRNLRAVQELLGHSSLSITERYCAVDDDEMRAAMMAAQYAA